MASFASFAPYSLDLLNRWVCVVQGATICRFLNRGRLSWVQRGLKQGGFAYSLLTQDWGEGGLRSVPAYFVPLCHPHLGLLPTATNRRKAQCGPYQHAARLSHVGNAAGNCGRGWESSWISTNGCFPWLITQPASSEDILSQSRAYSAFSGLHSLLQYFSLICWCFRAAKIRHKHTEKRKSENVSAALV